MITTLYEVDSPIFGRELFHSLESAEKLERAHIIASVMSTGIVGSADFSFTLLAVEIEAALTKHYRFTRIIPLSIKD